MKQTIKFLRKEAPYASKTAAITGLNSVSHVCGQPVVAFYKYTPTGGSEETRVALAIGLSTGTGATNYRLVADNAELSEYESLLGSYATQLSNHISTLANGDTAGHARTGGDITFTNGVGTVAFPKNFAKVKAGTTDIEPASATDTLNIAGGSNITVTGNNTSKTATIALTTNPALGAATASTAAAGTNTEQVATTAFVQTEIANKIAAADAMIYKGTIGTVEDGGTVQELPYTTAKTGWTYKVVTAGSYTIAQGKTAACEEGDMIICLTDATQSTGATWTVVQNNIDGAVTGPASSTADHIATFNNTSGKVIKDSGIATDSMVLASGGITTGNIAAFASPSSTGAKQIIDGGIATGQILTKSDASSTYALKTVSVTGSNGLTGGGTLSESRVISHAAKPTKKPINGFTITPSSGTLVTSIDVDQYGHVVTAGGVDLSVNGSDGSSSSGKYVSNVQWNGTTKTQLDVTYTTLPTHTESGKVKVDASDGANYLENKVVTGTANLTGNNNTYAVTAETAGSGTSKTVALTCTIDTIDGGTF